MIGDYSSKNYELQFPLEMGELIVLLIKKYNLGPTSIFTDKEFIDLMEKARTSEEKANLLNNLPLDKIVAIIKEIMLEGVTLKNLPRLLQERLDIDSGTATNLFEDIEKLLPLIKKIPVGKEEIKKEILEEIPPVREVKEFKEIESKPASEKTAPSKNGKATAPQNKDSYREKIG